MTHRPRKRFGQHFLHDPGVIRKIVDAIRPLPGQVLVEIGPGTGAITRPLLERAGTLHAVELDRELATALEQRCAGPGELIVHRADALRFDFSELAPADGRIRLVGNLPYNISTPLIFHVLEQRQWIEDMHFMLQQEVVDRMAARPGSRQYGRLTVMLAAACRVERLFSVGPGAFRPPPRVRSAVVRMIPWASPPFDTGDHEVFARLVNRAFSMRRKTLRNALKGILAETEIVAAGVDPGCRAETLEPAAFAALSRQARANTTGS